LQPSPVYLVVALRASVKRELEARQAIRLCTLSLIQPLGQEQLDYAPAQGKWSVGEIVDHILLIEQVERGFVEELILLTRGGKQPFVRRSLADYEMLPAFAPRRLMLFLDPLLSFFSLYVPLGLRAWLMRWPLIPFHTPAQAAPRRCLPGDELRGRLVASLQSTASRFKANEDLDFRSLVHRHSILGSLDMIDMLRLVGNHEMRHQKQIAKTIRRFPN